MSRAGTFLSAAAEDKLREAFARAKKPELPSHELMRLLTTEDASTVQAAYNMISYAHRDGLLTRTGGRQCYTYKLDPHWCRPLPRGRDAGDERRDTAPAIPYEGPAFGSGPLLQSIGTAFDDELLEPCIGARIVDSLHRQFHEAFVE